ncbi:MAG TPA: hypothetical protein VKE40_28255, partial [Gemmataceae bacterium]|nr:hypothetical protein [Gemmataceae bacterium]
MKGLEEASLFSRPLGHMHMRPIRPEEPGAAKDSASMADALPPIYYPWLVVVGLILPYAVIIAGWWL